MSSIILTLNEWRTKGHYPFSIKFNHRESFHNLLLAYNLNHGLSSFFFTPATNLNVRLEKISLIWLRGGSRLKGGGDRDRLLFFTVSGRFCTVSGNFYEGE